MTTAGLWNARLRPLVLRALGNAGLLPLAYRFAVASDLRRRARTQGLSVQALPDGAISILAPGLPGKPSRAVWLAARHTPYAYGVVTCFDYCHGAVEPELLDGIEVVDYSTPRLHRLRPSGDLFRFTGLAEPEETTEVYLRFASLEPGQLAIDLGAYCGASTVAFARAVTPSGHVLALEPDSANAAALRENIERHRLSNVTVQEAGVWSETTTLPFAAEGNMGSALAAVLPRGAATRRSVQVLSLADAVARACQLSGIPRVAFIKMDIEGAELEVLQGCEDVLRKHWPRLAIEPHSTLTGSLTTDMTANRLIRLLNEIGYRCDLAAQGTGTGTLVLASAPGVPTNPADAS